MNMNWNNSTQDNGPVAADRKEGFGNQVQDKREIRHVQILFYPVSFPQGLPAVNLNARICGRDAPAVRLQETASEGAGMTLAPSTGLQRPDCFHIQLKIA